LNSKTTLITNEKCWMEHTALTQLENVSNLNGVIRAVGLPDLHAGKSPVGIAVETEGMIYPHLIGNDIGCGMGLFETHVSMHRFKQDKIVSRLNNIRSLEDIPAQNPYPEESPIYDLGTIGGGNHFAEYQTIDTIYDEEAFKTLDIDKGQLLLLIHSGSRGYGQQILSEFLVDGGFESDSQQGTAYIMKHDNAVIWAMRNRIVVARKLMDWLGYASEIKPILDCHHNYLEKHNGILVHRKGAVSALNGPVIIPGSRGSLTYIVKPSADTDASACSLSHGAGRKWARSLCKSRIINKYDRDTIRQNKFGGRVVCHDTELLFQEAPEAYKNIDQVISSLLEHNLCSVIATLRPLITYKG
jgi:release factor H-coupled RctB family protein